MTMLRGQSDQPCATPAAPAAAAAVRTDHPGIEQPYATGERPPGILFYRGQSGFWLPYHLLQGMRCEPEKLTLTFASAEVVIEGRGLHSLYVELAHQVVWRVIEQGTRYAAVSEGATCISRIVEIPKGKGEERE